MGTGEAQAYLTHQALEEHISASTQNQAHSALLFLHRNVLSQVFGLVDSVRAKPSQPVPTVLSRAELLAVLHEMSGIHLLIASLLYGSDTRLMEFICLRVKVWILSIARLSRMMPKVRTTVLHFCLPV